MEHVILSSSRIDWKATKPDADCVYAAQKPRLTSGYPTAAEPRPNPHTRYLSQRKINVRLYIKQLGEKALDFWNKVYLLQTKKSLHYLFTSQRLVIRQPAWKNAFQ